MNRARCQLGEVTLITGQASSSGASSEHGSQVVLTGWVQNASATANKARRRGSTRPGLVLRRRAEWTGPRAATYASAMRHLSGQLPWLEPNRERLWKVECQFRAENTSGALGMLLPNVPAVFPTGENALD